MSRRPVRPEETGESALDAALDASFPASDPVAVLEPAAERPAVGSRARARDHLLERNMERNP